MKVLGIVPARGGSKGIERKNLRTLCGKSLLAWTAEAALESRLDRVILSTDCDEIASHGRSLGLEVPFMRPAHLADDKAPSLGVVTHCWNWLINRDSHLRIQTDKYAVMLLQPTNPLRTTTDINASISLMETTKCDSVLSFTPVGEFHPVRMRMIDNEGKVYTPALSQGAGQYKNSSCETPGSSSMPDERRQNLCPLYLRDGSIYLSKLSVIDSGRFQGDDCRALVIPRERSVRIDEHFDLEVAEWMMNRSAVALSR